MGALHELPEDVLAMILCKLAWQDTPALFRATFACKALESAAKNLPNFWKTAFLFPSVLGNACGKEFKEFEVKVEAFGGYKQLLEARAVNVTLRKKDDCVCSETNDAWDVEETSDQEDTRGEQTQSPGSTSSIGPGKALQTSPGFKESALVMIYLESRPVAYGVFDPWQAAHRELFNRFVLRPLIARTV